MADDRFETSGETGEAIDLDFRGSRRLTGAEEWFWYVLAAITYIVAGIWHKWLLNWLIGPIWLVTFVVVGPWLFDRVRRRFTRGAT